MLGEASLEISPRAEITPGSTSFLSTDTSQDLERVLTHPSSWLVYKRPEPVLNHVADLDYLRDAVQTVRDWLSKWIIDGSTPFIHRQACAEHMPSNILNAFTASATYFSSTSDTKVFALHAIGRHTTALIQESAKSSDVHSCPLAVCLVRVQALLVYQAIRLYDGDIRARAQAEKASPVLKVWAKEMLSCAFQSSQYVRFFSPKNHVVDQNEAWKSWVLAESVRRAWIAVFVIESTYLLMKGEAASCAGHVLFTARKGLWSARSATAWKKAQKDCDPLFYDHCDGQDIFEKATKEEVDEYALWALRCSAGVEAFENWSKED